MDRTAIRNQILQILAVEEGLTATEIASQIAADRREVYSLLLQDLSSAVRHDPAFRWFLIGASQSAAIEPHQLSLVPDLPLVPGTSASPSQYLKEFLGRRNLSRADERPLYAYRCSNPEFAELERMLIESVRINGQRFPSDAAAAFTLFAAEWWKRHHVGGPWKWDPIFHALGLEVLNIYEVYPYVSSGLQKFWKRPLLKNQRGRMFLVTLACEGGLPLQMVRREGARLRSFFRHLLEDYAVYSRAGISPEDLARRSAGELPKSLRHDVVLELGARLVGEIWKLQSRIGKSKQPVRDLDRIDPQWCGS